jgi:hypothetical protein
MKTAVEYLSYMYALQGAIYQVDIDKAIEMEKEHIRKSFSDGAQWELYGCDLTHEERSEEYYNEIFKQEQ